MSAGVADVIDEGESPRSKRKIARRLTINGPLGFDLEGSKYAQRQKQQVFEKTLQEPTHRKFVLFTVRKTQMVCNPMAEPKQAVRYQCCMVHVRELERNLLGAERRTKTVLPS